MNNTLPALILATGAKINFAISSRPALAHRRADPCNDPRNTSLAHAMAGRDSFMKKG